MAAPALRVPLWYSAAWLLALPGVALYLVWRALRQPDYLRHWGERFLGAGRAPAGAAPCIWLHAVSLGETRAAQPLLQELARRHPEARFLLTHMTPTGRAAGAELARALPGRVRQAYLPYDLPWALRRFLRRERPRLGVLMETEIWPNLLAVAAGQGVPVVLANARLSERSLQKGLRHADLLRAVAAGIGCVGAQSEADARRLARLYDGPVAVTGNLKFDQEPDAAQQARGRALRRSLDAAGAGPRPLWLFASTRDGEERLLLEAWDAAAARRSGPAPRLLFVPRHPQRFEEVAELLRARGAGLWRRAQWGQAGAAEAPPLLLGDSLGEMPLYYAMADAALIGGSLLPLGGQNLIEACACGCPVVLGPHMFNFAQASADALAAGAALLAPDAAAALASLDRITSEPGLRERMAQAGLAFSAAHRGATARTADLLDQALAGSPFAGKAGEG